MHKLIKPVLISLTAIGCATALFIQSFPSGYTEHKELIEHLRGLMQKNTELNADIVQIRQGSLKNYDTLEDKLSEVNAILNELKSGDNKIYGIGDPRIDDNLNNLTSLFTYKGDYITSFKLHNGLMRNSLDYLPSALDKLYSTILKKDKNEVLHRRIEDSLRFTIMYTIKNEEKWRRDALAHINWLRKSALEQPRKVKLAIRLLSDHMEVVINSSDKVDELIMSISDHTTSKIESDLYQNYMTHYERKAANVSPYSIGLYILTLLLSIGIVVRPLINKD